MPPKIKKKRNVHQFNVHHVFKMLLYVYTITYNILLYIITLLIIRNIMV